MTAKTKPDAADTAAKPEIPTRPLLSELAGMSTARAWGERLSRDIADYRAGTIKWSDVDPGCVLHGPPGTGKTTFATALAATCKLPLIATSFSAWQAAEEGHLGTLLAAMESSFALARANAPCILFVDELDSIPRRGSGSRSMNYWNQVTNALLKAIDSLAEATGVVMLGACNHPGLLDPALVRAGRMDQMIAIELPDAKAIATILSFHLKPEERQSVGSLASIAKICVGMSGADLARLARSARALARSNRRVMRVRDLIAVLDPPELRLSPEQLKRIAVHEAGHAVAAHRLAIADDITLSLVARNTANGIAGIKLRQEPVTRTLVEARLVMLLAGRAAEEVFFGQPSASAGGDETSDLAHANRTALDAVVNLGLSTHNPLGYYVRREQHDKAWYPTEVRAEVDEMLASAYRDAVALMGWDWDFVNQTAEALVRDRGLSYREFALLDRRPRAA